MTAPMSSSDARRMYRNCSGIPADAVTKRLSSIFERLFKDAQAELVEALWHLRSVPNFRQLLIASFTNCANGFLKTQVEFFLPRRHLRVPLMCVGALHILRAPFEFDDLSRGFSRFTAAEWDEVLSSFSAMWAAALWSPSLLMMFCGRARLRTSKSLLDILKTASLSTESGPAYVVALTALVPSPIKEEEVLGWIQVVKFLATLEFDVSPMVRELVSAIRASRDAVVVIKFVGGMRWECEKIFNRLWKELRDLLTTSLTSIKLFERCGFQGHPLR